MKQISASAPGKLMLVGSHAVVYDRPALVTAVNQRLTVVVKENGTDVFHLDAPDLGLIAYSKTIDQLGKKELPKSVRFIETLYKNFLSLHPQKRGIIVTTKSDFSSSFGFGSSSAVTVAFAKALTCLYGLKLTNQELFEMCYQTVLEVQGVGSGFDIASAIWGGTIKYVTPAKVVETMKISHLPIVVGYTGIKADTPTLVRMVDSKLANSPAHINQIFDEIGQVTEKTCSALVKKDFPLVGQQFNRHQELMRKLGVSSIKLENLIFAALSAGAYGATLSGAGGGDCMIAMADIKKIEQVKAAIKKAGGEVMDVELNQEGVRIE